MTLLYLLKKSHYSCTLYSFSLEHAGKERTREGLMLISIRTFCSMLPSTLLNSKNENVLVTVETSEGWNAETNANCNPKIVILGFIHFFPKWKRLSRRQQQELSNHSVTERPDKLGLCSKRTERLKNIQQTAVSEQPNQATKTIQSTWSWGRAWDRWCWSVYSVLTVLWSCDKPPNSGFPEHGKKNPWRLS